ncbi:hypothetical protein ASE14_18880 [Agromyces sp. Root81]|uniref:hypothetical protein n=1 Tax=Agromyces sp. Root81 TaxID=1736601 RepID=UPI0006F7F0E3|nr:hypothetical protein [Agromyces sp. Root81]KRC58618.1 hypothetical protein ASE14_18880 [Agromyces sp. Root81]
MSNPNPAPAPLSHESRAQLLNAEVARYAQRGWTVQSVAAGQAVLSKNKRIGWFWNLILVLLTGGLWLIYVVYRALNRKVQTVVITVDASGRISTS